MTRLTLAAALLTASPIYGGVQYYLTDKLTEVDRSRWATVGTLSPSAHGLAAPDFNGGALISRVPTPDGSAEVEVLAAIPGRRWTHPGLSRRLQGQIPDGAVRIILAILCSVHCRGVRRI